MPLRWKVLTLELIELDEQRLQLVTAIEIRVIVGTTTS
jgi:hypothetical protein